MLFLSVSCLRAFVSLAALTLGMPVAHADITFTKVLEPGQDCPEGGKFTTALLPILSKDTIFFTAKYTGGNGNEGLFTVSSDGGVLSKVLTNNPDDAPTGLGQVSFLPISGQGAPASMDRDHIAFTAMIQKTPVVFLQSGSALNSLLPGGATPTLADGRTLEKIGANPIVRGNQVAFVGEVKGEGKKALFLTEDLKTTLIATPDTIGIDKLDTLAPIHIHNNRVIFFASKNFDTSGIYASSGDKVTPLVSNREGSNSVPSGGTFTSIGIANSNSDDTIVFVAVCKAAASGLFRLTISTGEIQRVVSIADPVPGMNGGTFRNLLFNSVSGKRIVFYSIFELPDPGKSEKKVSAGIFTVEDDGTVRKVLLDGDELFGKKVENVWISQQALQGDQLVFNYSFTKLAIGKPTTPEVGIALAKLK